jgi:hypothetical protein
VSALAEVLRQGGAAYLRTHALSTPQARAWRAICACRTPLLGGQRLACAACGHSHWHYHSCRNRHCPQCGARAKDAWLQGRLAEVLEVPYTHLVFTLPHSLNSLYRASPKWLIETLFASVAATLKAFAANARWMGVAGGQPALQAAPSQRLGPSPGTGRPPDALCPGSAFSLVLHTWSQDLSQHLHLHAVMACGVLKDGQWHRPTRSPGFLFPVHALSPVFRAQFMAELRWLAQTADTPQDASLTPTGRKALMRKPWVVYAKTPLGGPAQVLEYLSRYTHRTAISNERIRAVNPKEVRFTARADFAGGKRLITLPTEEFIGRFLLHILPGGTQRVRHFGVLAKGCKKTQLAQARAALQQPAPNPQARESARDFMARVTKVQTATCPQCKGPLQVVQTLPGLKHLPAPGQAHPPRGPP